MKKLLTLIAVIAASNIYAQNVKDYFYQPNNTTILDQVYMSNGVFLSTAKHTISSKYESIQGRQYLSSIRYITELGSYGSAYFIQNYYLIADNSVILFAQTKIAGSSRVDYEVNTPILKMPPTGKELAWDNVYGKYIAKIVILPIKAKTNISSVKVVKYDQSGEISEIEYWCKGWGLSLVLNRYGSILMANQQLFDLNLLNNCSEVLYYVGKEGEQREGEKNIEAQFQTENGKYKIDNVRANITDRSLFEFISKLKEIVANRDTIKIKECLGGYMLYYFNLNPKNHDKVAEYYGMELHNNKSKVWGELQNTLSAGCYKTFKEREGLDEYIFPWYEGGVSIYTGTWDEQKETMINIIVEDHVAGAIIGENINVRSAPNTTSSVVANLSWEVIRIDREYDASRNNYSWGRISTLDNKVSGYVSSRFLFTPVTTRIVIAKDIFKYKYDNKYFRNESDFYGYLYEKEVQDPSSIVDSGKYNLSKQEQKDDGWKIIYVRTWD